MRTRTCSTCQWQEDFHCHYDPPSVQLVMAQGFHGQMPQPISFHPPVKPTEFCARWTAIGADGIIDV